MATDKLSSCRVFQGLSSREIKTAELAMERFDKVTGPPRNAETSPLCTYTTVHQIEHWPEHDVVTSLTHRR